MKTRLIKNSIKTPDGTILVSRHTHDFVVHTDSTNGNQYGVDGGTSYQRRIGNTQDCEDLSISIDEDKFDEEFTKVRECLEWGSRGKKGDQPLKWLKISEMTDEHLNSLANLYGGPIDEFYKKSFIKEVEYRKENKISVNDF